MQASRIKLSEKSDIQDRIKQLQISKGLTNKAFAEIIGISPQSLHDVVAGKRSVPSSNVLIKLVSEMPDVNSQWLLTGEGEMFLNDVLPKKLSKPDNHSSQSMAKVYLLDDDVAAAAGMGALAANNRTIDSYDYIELDELVRSKTYCRISVRGDSMYPTLADHDKIICCLVEEDLSNSLKNDYIYVIVTKNGEILVKRVLNRIKERQSLYIKSDNRSHQSYYIHISEVAFVWEVKLRITANLSNTNLEIFQAYTDLEERQTQLEQEMKLFKNFIKVNNFKLIE